MLMEKAGGLTLEKLYKVTRQLDDCKPMSLSEYKASYDRMLENIRVPLNREVKIHVKHRGN